MTRPWDAEQQVDAARAKDLITHAFPALALCHVVPFGSGWDNAAFLVDGALVFRFPRKAASVAFLENEARALPLLAKHLPLPIPTPAFVAQPSSSFPFPFAGYPLVAGTTACRKALDDAERARAAPVLGRFLGALHGLDVDLVPLPGDVLGRTDFVARRLMLDERLAALGGLVDAVAVRALFRDAGPPTTTRRAIVHGDLYARHLLVDDAHDVVGVIDWGDVHRGDPAVDLQIAYAFLPPAARASFFAAYGRSIDDDTAATARRRAVFHSISTAWFARDVGDDALAVEALRGVANALAG